ncbi:MAG: tetratricopeptide repeat protein [Candidatus Omnitrophota bacterium]
MKTIIVFLCLGLIGCATVTKENKNCQTIEKPKVIDVVEVDSAIAVFSKAIETNPNYSGAYYNRAIAYFHRKDYEKSWQDVHKAESLGLKFNPVFIEALGKASKGEN